RKKGLRSTENLAPISCIALHNVGID
ncbi:MAG: hypothetical protein EZS28_041819, partial [Streblomastix strix]